MTTTDSIGFIGVSILLIAYLLNLFKYLPDKSKLYIVLNILGAGIACYASILLNYIPFIILEGVWTFVSVVALIKALLTSPTS